MMLHFNILLVGFSTLVLGSSVNSSDELDCTTSNDCPSGNTCINNTCVDPCDGACGPNTDCYLDHFSPLCSCKPGYVGDPFTGCNTGDEAVCTSASHCHLNQTCVNLKCVDPCVGACGQNSVCKVINHRQVCVCEEDFTWNSVQGCLPRGPSQCISDIHCPDDRACVNQTCVDTCLGLCGDNAQCQVTEHHASCACASGYEGNPFLGCNFQYAVPIDALNNTWIANKTIIPANVVLEKKYHVVNDQLTWLKALEHCLSIGMHLVSIDSETEQTEVVNAIRNSDKSMGDTWTSGITIDGSQFWMSSSSSFSYTNWHSSSPDNSTNCIGLRSSSNYKWAPYSCNVKASFVCEYHELTSPS